MERNDRLFRDVPVDDPVAPSGGVLEAQRHDEVVPAGVRGLRHVGGRRIGRGVGVAVHHADHLESVRLGLPVRTQVLAGVDRVDAARLGHVAGGDEPHDLVAAVSGLAGSCADQQAARLVRQAVEGVGDHRGEDLVGHPEHGVGG
jgi:hypothetical protein